jgi:insulysin
MICKEEYRKVLAVLFQYITLLPDALSHPHHFTELRTMKQIGFNYASKQPADVYARSLSQSMNEEEYKREHIVSHSISEWEFNKGDVQDIIDCLELRNARIMLAAKVFEGVDVPPKDEWMKERWYGTEYAKREFDPEELPVSYVAEHDGK